MSQKTLMPLYELGAQVTNPINPQGLGLLRSSSPYCMPRFQFSDAVLKQKQQDQQVSAAIIICIAVTTIVVLATVLKKGSRGLKSLQVFPQAGLEAPLEWTDKATPSLMLFSCKALPLGLYLDIGFKLRAGFSIAYPIRYCSFESLMQDDDIYPSSQILRFYSNKIEVHNLMVSLCL